VPRHPARGQRAVDLDRGPWHRQAVRGGAMKRTYESKMEELYKKCSIVQKTCFELCFYSTKKPTSKERDDHVGDLIQGLHLLLKDAGPAVDWKIIDISMCSYPAVQISSLDPTEVRRLGWLVYSFLKRRKHVVLNP
jgi:hypothetical protein